MANGRWIGNGGGTGRGGQVPTSPLPSKAETALTMVTIERQQTRRGHSHSSASLRPPEALGLLRSQPTTADHFSPDRQGLYELFCFCNRQQTTRISFAVWRRQRHPIQRTALCPAFGTAERGADRSSTAGGRYRIAAGLPVLKRNPSLRCQATVTAAMSERNGSEAAEAGPLSSTREKRQRKR